MRTLKLVVSYDGTNYCGWQIQPNGVSIQAVLAQAIQTVTGELSNPVASGRTDSGVHALAQIVAMETNSKLSQESLKKGLNANLPREIRIRSISEVPAGFDPVRHAKHKWYRYLIDDGDTADVFSRRYAWRVHYRLDVSLMDADARFVEGTHDFRCFESEWPNRATSVRTVYRCRAHRLGNLVVIDVEADGFLYNMVRAIAGSLFQIGRGKWQPGQMATIIAAKDRTQAGPTAPACGLFLMHVDYGDVVETTQSQESR